MKAWKVLEKEGVGTASLKNVRGPPDAVVCETRDLGIGFPSWYVLLFEEGTIS